MTSPRRRGSRDLSSTNARPSRRSRSRRQHVEVEAFEERTLLSISAIDVSVLEGNPGPIVLSGALDPANEIDTYQIQGRGGQRIKFDLTGASSNNAYWNLYGPDSQNFGGTYFPNDFTTDLPADGIYTLVIQGTSTNPSAVSYDFEITDISDAAVPLSSNFGATQSGSIAAGEVKTITYNAPAGSLIVFDSLDPDGDPIYFELRDPNNQVVSSGSASNDSGVMRLTKSGSYTMRVFGGSTSDTGDYKFRLLDLATNSTPLAIGTSYSGTLPDSATVIYRFDAAPGQKLYYDALDNDFEALNATIYDPDGDYIYSQYYSDYDSGQISTNWSGAHYLLQSSKLTTGTADYAFRMLDATRSPATTITPGTDVSASLATGRERVLYRFAGTAGQALWLDWRALTTNGGSAYWTLNRPDGSAIASGYAGGDSGLIKLPSDGQYVLDVAGSYSNSAEFKYTFRLLDAAVQKTDLTFGTAYTGTLADNSAAIYRFAGTAGQRLLYDGLDADYDAVAKYLYAPDGVVVVFNGENADYDTAPFFLPLTGTYTLVISNQVSSGTPDHSFRLLDMAAAPLAEVSTTVSGTLNPGQSTNLYRFQGTRGQQLYLDFTAVSSTNASWYLYRPDSNNYVASNSVGYDRSLSLPVDGTYVLAIFGNSATTLDYSFRFADPAADGAALTLGTIYSSTLSGQSSAIYRFSGTAGQRLLYDALDNDNDAVYKTLYAPDGTVVIFNGENADYDTAPFYLPQTGTYTLVINSQATSGNPDQKFRLLDVSGSTLLTAGTSASGTVPGYGSAVYRFHGTAGQQILVDSSAVSSTNGSWYLYRPDSTNTVMGTTIGYDATAVLPADGDYALVLFSNQSAGLNFRFRIDDLATAGTVLAPGAEATGSLASYGAVTYRFNGTAGQRLVFDPMEDDSENLRVWITDPSGQRIQDLTESYDTGPFTLASTGQYAIVVTSQDAAATDYRFRLIDAAQSPAQALALDTPTSGTLNPGVKAAVYRFDGTAGQRLYVDFTAGSSGSYGIYRPDNGYIGGTSIGYDSEVELTQTGRYLIVVYGNSATAIDYTFRANLFTASSTSLTLGTVVDGTISVPGETDSFAIALTAGQRIFFDGRIGPASGTFYATLYTPEGSPVFSIDMMSDAGLYTITRPGTYRLVIDGAGEATGSYRFLLSEVAGSTTTALSLGTTYNDTLDPGRETQLYRFAGTAGQRVTVASTGTGGAWYLLGPGNNVLGNSGLGGTGTIVLPMAGTYVVEVYGYSDTAQSYSLTVTDATPAPVTNAGFNVVQSGTLAASAFKEYSFTARAGTLIYLDSQKQDTNYAYYQLFDPDGQNVYIANYANSDSGPHSLAKTGTYSLRVTNLSGSSDSSYKFRLLDLGTASTALTLGQATTGTLPDFEADVYSFAGTVGQRLFYDGHDIDFDAVGARLYRADGAGIMNVNSDSNYGPFTLNTAGTYYLILSNDSASGTPDYSFRLTDLAKSPTATLPLDGTTVSGTIDPAYSSVAYRFNGTAGQLVYFDPTAATSGVSWFLYSPEDRSLTYFTTSELMYKLPAAGEYLLIGYNDSASVQPYSLRALAPATTATAITFGTTYTDTIAAQSSKLYTFTGAVGQRLIYDALDRDFDSVSVNLYDPDGNLVHLSQNSDYDREPFTLVKAGLYTLAMDVDATVDSDVSFRLIDADQSPAKALAFGTAATSVTIDPGREVEVFRFNGTAGQMIYLDMLGGSGSVSWYLYRPDNNWEVNGNIASDSLRTLTQTGEYLLVFWGDSTTPVTFSLRLLDAAVQSTTLTLGTTYSGTLPDQSAAFYRFNGTAGQVLLYDGLDTDLDAVNVYVYSDSGTYLLGQNADYSSNPFRLPTTGTYYLLVTSTAAGTPDYSFRLLDAGASPSKSIAYDAPQIGTLDPGNSDQIYTFTGTAGQRLYMDFSSASTGLGSWYLYNPDLNYIVGTYFGNDQLITLNQSGTYYLVLFGQYNNTPPLSYAFTLEQATDTVAAYTLGTTQAGTIDRGGDYDFYTFTGTPGQRLYFDGITGSGAYVRLYSPEGSQVFESWSYYDSAPFTISQAGTYTLRIEGNGGATGAYSFRILDAAASPTISLTEGTEYAGQLNPGTSTQLYRFTGTAGDRFYFDSRLTSSEYDGYWSLYRPDNGTLLGQYFFVDQEVILPVSGTYLLALAGNDNAAPVDYDFVVRFNHDTVSPLTLDQVTVGSTSESGENRVYTFTGTPGQQVIFDGLNDPSGPYSAFYARLYSPEGAEILGQYLPADNGPITLKTPGTYRLVIDGQGDAIGSFRFKLIDPAGTPPLTLGTTIAEVTVSLSAPQAGTVTVDYTTANGTATLADDDYTSTSGTLVFAPGETSKVIRVLVTRDTAAEADETVLVNLSNPSGDTIADGQAVITILNDDGPSIFLDNPQVVEGDAGTKTITFTVSLSAAPAVPVTVDYATADGTATAGSDYVAKSGTLTFAVGETSKTVSITVNGDTAAEGDETFFLNLSNPVAGVILDNQGVGTIRNDDTAISVSGSSVAEGQAGTSPLTFTITLSQPVAQSLTVNYSTANGTATAGSDYNAKSGTVTFNPGETSRTVTIDILGDTTLEPNETVFLNLTGSSSGTIAVAQATGIIVNDDAEISIADAEITEGDSGTKTLNFTVTLSPASASTVTVDYTTLSGTATGGSDFAATSGTLTFAPGETSKTIAVTIYGDTVAEAFETFQVALSGATNATISDATAVGTIQNDDAAFYVDDVSVAEGNSGTTTVPVTVRLLYPVVGTVTVKAATSDGSATAPADYASLAATTVTFAPGQTSKTVDVSIVGDGTPEPNETLFVVLSDPSSGILGDGQAIVTILNDDTTVSISDPSVVEGNSGTTTLNFTVTLSVPSAVAVTVNYTTANGTASAGSDYDATSGTLTFAPGETSKTIAVTIHGDTTPEAFETVIVNLSGVSNAVLADSQGVGTIQNDDAALSVGDLSVLEGDSGTTPAVFTVSMPFPVVQVVTVTVATANGTATAGSDYAALSPFTLTFNPGEVARTVTVDVTGDTTAEANETFQLNLSGATGATIADASATGTILNDDTAISVSDATATEGDSGTTTLTFTVSLSAASAQPVTVGYFTANGTAVAPGDYATLTGTLTFAAGETSKTVSVTIVGDTLDEPDETLFLQLQNATNAVIADATGVGTIVDDDAPVSVSIGDASVAEGTGVGGSLVFTVSLSAASGKEVKVNFATSPGTATSPSDFAAISGTLTFAPGETTKTITVAVVGDGVDEPDEAMTVALSGAVNATIADGTATGTILDDDSGSGISVSDASVTEGDSGTTSLTFTVTLASASGQAVKVDYATVAGTATAGVDYTATSGTLTFAPGETTKTVTVAVVGDVLDEEDETLSLVLSNAVNATIGDGTGLGTIVDDDAPVSVSVGDATVVEGTGGSSSLVFTVSLSAVSGKEVKVNYATADGTAVAGSDYTATSGTLTFAPGETTKTVSVVIAADGVDEPDETFSFNLSGALNATIGDGSGTGTIVDDDEPTNRPPTAADDTASTTDQAAVTIPVLANDTDPDLPGDTLQVVAVGGLPDGVGTVSYTASGVTYTPAPNTHGPVSFTYTVRDGGGLESTATVTVNVTDITRPQVVDLLAVVGSQKVSILNTTRTLPWTTLKGFEVKFSEDVAVDEIDLALKGVKVPNYNPSSFTYDPATHTARWDLPTAVGVDRLLLALDGDAGTGGVVDKSGNALLGGDFTRTLRILPGDFDNDGVVTIRDTLGIRDHSYLVEGALYSIWADLDGDGDVDADDINATRGRINSRLP